MGTSIIVILFGAGITYLGYKILDNRKKYEFQNRTDGGVVQFKNWNATKSHALLKGLGKIVGVIGVIITGIGVFLLIMK